MNGAENGEIMEFQQIKTKEGHIIRHECIECSRMWNYLIYDGDRVMGRCIVISREDYRPIIDDDEEIFIDIVIFNEEDRNKGIASELMQFVCNYGNHYALISSALDKRGREFGLKHGWKIKKGLTKNQPDVMYFKKEE